MMKKIMMFVVMVVVAVSVFAQPYMKEIIEVAKAISYYNTRNSDQRYTSRDQFSGQCGDFALLFAIKTGADLIVDEQGLEMIPSGRYRVIGENKEFFTLSGIKKNDKSGFFYWTWDDGTSRKFLIHPVIGCFEIELVEAFDVLTHGNNGRFEEMSAEGNGPHVWNYIDGLTIDVAWFDGGWESPYFTDVLSQH